MIKITASDGYCLSAYKNEGSPEKVSIVLLHEIFGITLQMKETAQQFAAIGHTTLIPALFERVSKKIVLDYAEHEKGRSLANLCKVEQILLDVKAAMDALPTKAVVIGYCWGGTFAYLAACKLDILGAVAYYGTRITEHLDHSPIAPLICHFGEEDTRIPPESVEKICQAAPKAQIFTYKKAGHAFANQCRLKQFNAEATQLAFNRTMQFIDSLSS